MFQLGSLTFARPLEGAALAAEAHFNATAPLRPSAEDYRDIVADALG